MKLFVNGFWDGFMDRINPVHIGFFLDLFENVFACNIEISSLVLL